MGTECTSGKTGIGMRASGGIVLSMDKELIFSQTVIPTPVLTSRVSPMDTVNTNGKTVVFMSESSRTVSKTARANGRKCKIINSAISMMVNIRMIRKMDMAYLLGNLEMFIKEVMSMMRGRDMAKCSGPTDPCIKVNGSVAFNMVMAR